MAWLSDEDLYTPGDYVVHVRAVAAGFTEESKAWAVINEGLLMTISGSVENPSVSWAVAKVFDYFRQARTDMGKVAITLEQVLGLNRPSSLRQGFRFKGVAHLISIARTTSNPAKSVSGNKVSHILGAFADAATATVKSILARIDPLSTKVDVSSCRNSKDLCSSIQMQCLILG